MRQMKVMSKRDIIRPSDSVPKETRNLKKQSGIDSLSYKTKHTSKFLIGYFDVNFIMLDKTTKNGLWNKQGKSYSYVQIKLN